MIMSKRWKSQQRHGNSRIKVWNGNSIKKFYKFWKRTTPKMEKKMLMDVLNGNGRMGKSEHRLLKIIRKTNFLKNSHLWNNINKSIIYAGGVQERERKK